MNKSLIFFLLLLFLTRTHFAQTKTEPVWWKHASIYQVYPRSFMDSNADGIGDIQGIISKLDYIKSLGFDAIWFSPFFESPQQDFGYDISNYLTVDEDYGVKGDAECLIEEVHRRGMKIIFDMVLNHTSIQHPWFIESLEKNSDKSDWYVWQEGKGRKPPNNWKNMIGQKAWQYSKEREEWFYSSFLPFQADLNWRNPEVIDTMFNTVRFWLDRGVDGFRLDIFNVIVEDERFIDNPHGVNYFPGPENPAGGFQRLRHNFNHEDNYYYARELRKVLNEYEGRFLIGEVEGEHSRIKGFLGEGSGLHSIFLFDFIYFDFSADFFRQKINEYELFYPDPLVPVYVYSNHDVRRSIGRVDEDLEKAKLLAFVQLTTRGIAVVYQGEEIGASDTRIHKKVAKDPIVEYFNLPQFVLNKLPWLINRDECRTPMQWSDKKNAGFSTSENIWLPLNPNYREINVEKESQMEHSLLTVYRKLLHLRNENEILKFGSARIIDSKSNKKDVFVMEREFEGEKVWVILNFSQKSEVVELAFKNYRVLFSEKAEWKEGKVYLEGLGGIVLKAESP